MIWENVLATFLPSGIIDSITSSAMKAAIKAYSSEVTARVPNFSASKLRKYLMITHVQRAGYPRMAAVRAAP